jgi:iron(III) transport system permease protein
MWRWDVSRTIVVGLAVSIFAASCLAPVAYLLSTSLLDVESAFETLLLDSRQRLLLYNTALLGSGTALLATAIGALLGIALARVPMRGKAALRLVLGAPLLVPPYVAGFAWVYLGTGGALASDWTHSLPAAILVLSLVFYPLPMLATEVALRRVDGRLEEAALLVAPEGRVLRRITLPLAAPGIVAAALVVFVLAVSEFGVPGLLRVRVYATEVFTAFAALYDFGRASILAVPLFLLSAAVTAFAGALLGDRLVTARRRSGRHPPLLVGWRLPAGAAALAVASAAVGLPLAILAREALGARSVASVIGDSGDAIARSLLLAATGATAVVAVAVWLGYARARARFRIGRMADIVFLVLFATPSTIVGVGLIGLWNRPGPVGVVYGTDGMFLLAYLARFVPIAALILAASVRAVPLSHEEAAAVGGAGWLRTMSRVVLPQIRLGVAAAWVIAFVLAFGELGVSILVAPPGEATLPIRIYTLIANTPPSHMAVLALLQTLVIFTPLAVLGAAAALREVR